MLLSFLIEINKMPYSSATAEESATSSTKRSSSRQHRKPTIWTREKIYKLIDLYRASDCLWNHYSELYKNKDSRTKAIDHICESLGITKYDYGKKVHNLRNQFNSELKKYERRIKNAEGIRAISPKSCRWEHFEKLMFLRPIIERRPGYQPQCKSLVKNDECSTAETHVTGTVSGSQLGTGNIVQLELLSVEDTSNSSAKEQATCDLQVTPKSEVASNLSTDPSVNVLRRDSITIKSAETPNYSNAHGPGQPNTIRDQWDAFGELIANEFRNLNSAISRKKLKRKIMQVMLEVGEEDDQKYTSNN
ncbi:uncharacterized protein LOC117567908 [Drosophila albomicans]|uniref:Uncharacterized protein LOC117567908 n=1 Tax=Drosophila albomicans TaxID=7291 RepID=A0A6P8WXF1_DROAB|nr:uncharacterized protein LOC117567908 [Drosophila albomicans]